MPIPKSILSRPGALLVIAARTGQERANARLAAMGLNVRMCGVLNLLADEGALSQHEIGSMLNIDRTTMVELIDELEKAGILRREANPRDRRSHLIRLTAEGRAKQRRANAHGAHAVGIGTKIPFAGERSRVPPQVLGE